MGGNGRTPEENRLYASAASHCRPAAVKAATSAKGLRGRIDAKKAEIVRRDGPMPDDELDRAARAEIGRELTLGRARALTARRKAREAAELARAAERALREAEDAAESVWFDATGLPDCGSDGVNAA